MDFSTIVSEWDARIRRGEGAAVYHALRALKIADVPRAHRPAVAAIARRMGLLKIGMKLLREDYLEHRDSRAPEHEPLLTEYAALLTEIGATRISGPVLARFKQPAHPATFLYRALMHIKRWEYEAAAGELEAFVAKNTDAYWQSIGRLNLLASFIFLHRWDEASALAETLIASRAVLPPVPQGILAELQGQLLFFTGRAGEARAHFEHSHGVLSRAKNPAALFAEKWLMITDLMQKPWEDIAGRFQAFRARTDEMGHWEIARELDRFLAMRTHDEAVLHRLYFGSPFAGYREMLTRDLKWTPSQEALVHIGAGRREPRPVLDLGTFEFHDGEKMWAIGNPLERSLLKALTGDLYRPSAVGSLFELMYEGQYYDPVHAAQRVYQAIRRFRADVRENGMPFKIHAAKLGFSLKAEESFAIRYVLAENHNEDLEKARRHYGERTFTAGELAQFQNQSRRNANRWLGEHMQSGNVVSIGQGRARRYRIKAAA